MSQIPPKESVLKICPSIYGSPCIHMFYVGNLFDIFRLPQDVYQTAKVSKLLLAINSGKSHKYKRMKLDDIDLSDNMDSDSESDKEAVTKEDSIDTDITPTKLLSDLEASADEESKKLQFC